MQEEEEEEEAAVARFVHTDQSSLNTGALTELDGFAFQSLTQIGTGFANSHGSEALES